MEIIKAIPLGDIQISKSNPRKHFNEQKMQELTDSVKEKGVIVPIVVRPVNGKYELVYGARRLKASQRAEVKAISAIVRKLTDAEVLEFQLIENLQRDNVHPLEEAEGYEVLLKKHNYKTVDDIAAKVGKSRSYIYGRLKLCELIPENRKLFYGDKFSPSVALLVARVPKDLQKEAGKNVARGRSKYYDDDEPMSYRKAQKYISEEFMLQLRGAPFDTKDKTLCEKAGPCSICQKRTGNQKELFPDISSADVCTDPGCFKMKTNAFTQRMIAQAKAAGKKILSMEESKKLFHYETDTSPENKYINLDDKCWDLPKGPKYRELVKRAKDVLVVYAVQPFTNKLIEMIEKTEVPKLFKKIGLKACSSDSGRDPKALEKAKRENRVREAKRGFWINKVSVARDRRCMNVVILDILLEDLGVKEANKILGQKGEDSWSRTWDIPKLYEMEDKAVLQFIVKVISKKSEYLQDDDLKFLSTKLGFNIAKEYVITKTYLQALTKDQLVKLAGEVGLKKWLDECCSVPAAWPNIKKTELIDLFLKKGFKLEGKVPKEIAK